MRRPDVSDLAAFLLARIAEDEERAHAAVNHTPGRQHRDWAVNMAGWVVLADLPGAVVATGPESEAIDEAQHVVRWSPARVLAECETKRLLIEQQSRSPLVKDFSIRTEPVDTPVLRLLALPYADHPDYDVQWRP